MGDEEEEGKKDGRGDGVSDIKNSNLIKGSDPGFK